MDPNTPENTEEVLYDNTSDDLTPASSFPVKKVVFIAVGVIVVLIILIIGFMFVTRPSQQNGKVELTYWGLWNDPVIYQQVISDYEKDHPNVKIVYQKQDIKSRSNYIDYLRQRIKSGTGPDIYDFHNSWLVQLHDYLLPLPQSVLTSLKFKDEYYPVVQQDMTYNNAVYGIPMYVDTLAMYTNDDLFKAGGYQVPTDWDRLLDLSRLMTVPDKTTGAIVTSGVALGTYDNIDHASDVIAMLFAQSGVSTAALISSDNATAANARTNAIKALEYYTCFATTQDTCQAVWSPTMPDSMTSFATGKVAVYFGYSWDMLTIKAINPQLSFSVHPVPKLPGQSQTTASYWAQGISTNSKAPQAAYDFLAYLESPQTLTKIYAAEVQQRGMGTAYPRKDLYPLIKDIPLGTFAAQANSAESTLFSSNTYDGAIDDQLDTYLQGAIHQIVLQNASAESATDYLIDGIKQKLTSQ